MEELTNIGELLPRFLMEIFIAIICGGLIGLERGLRHKAAGLRDNVLICLGATLYMEVSQLIATRVAGVPADPGRIAAQVVTGIGFIGAGVIIHRRGDITGLTTAATIWVVAGIGLLIGAGYPLWALMLTGVILLTVTVLSVLERGMGSRRPSLLLKIAVRQDTTELREKLQEALTRHSLFPDSIRSEPAAVGARLTVICPAEPEDIRKLMTDLWTLPGVTEVEH